MVKITREKMLYEAINQFMESLNFYDVADGWLCGGITHSIQSKTTNKRHKTQQYSLKLPEQFVIGRQDVVENGILREVPIYDEQKIPNVRDFIRAFNAYFSSYYLTAQTNSGGEYNISYMEVIAEPRNAVITTEYTLDCVYYKTHKPYPFDRLSDISDLSTTSRDARIARLEDTIRMLEETDFAQRSRIQTLRERVDEERMRKRKAVRQIREQCQHIHLQMQNHIRKLYAENEVFDDCPVCYEEMKPSDLVVPTCCHYICKECVVKCEACPLCRDEYDITVLQG